MKTSKRAALVRHGLFSRAGVLVVALLTAGAVTAIARYESGISDPTVKTAPAAQRKPGPADNQSERNYVGADVAGKNLPLSVQTLQQGPLTQAQAQQIADALKDNQSTEGLVQVQRPDGSVSIDLQGRFQNVVIARKNEDGSISQACVDSSKAASAFLQSGDASNQPEPGSVRRSPVKE